MGEVLGVGEYLLLIYGLLLLPVLPAVSQREFFNNMCAGTFWKYGVVGLCLLFNSLISNYSLM
jgi:hypothetical protein